MNTLLVGLTQEEEQLLAEALKRFPEFKVMFRCSCYAQALELQATGTIEFTFISARVRDMSFFEFSKLRKSQGWTAILVGDRQMTSKLSLLAAEGYCTGRLAGFVSTKNLEWDLGEMMENMRLWSVAATARYPRPEPAVSNDL